MKLNLADLEKLADAAMQAARQAGKMISDQAGRKDLKVEKKTTGSNLAAQVVTEVDRKAQDIILEHLKPTCSEYDLGWLAEESMDDGSRLVKDYFWCVDPMDGTLPFIEKRPGYAVSIGLVSQDGVSQVGVVYDPLEHILYHAIRGIGAFRNEEPWRLETSSEEKFEVIDRGGAVLNVCWVLEHGAACFYVKPKPQDGGGCLWDYAATACIAEALGAWVSDSYGNPLELNRKESPFMNHKGILFAGSGAIAKEMML